MLSILDSSTYLQNISRPRICGISSHYCSLVKELIRYSSSPSLSWQHAALEALKKAYTRSDATNCSSIWLDDVCRKILLYRTRNERWNGNGCNCKNTES
uniref:Uncharacterized protein n=1 Tax=Parascaris univalens TaxID=6257 RepID=A0A915B693_PARUN